jgi:hypothetical protein
MQKNESNRDILKVTQSSPYLWASFHPQTSLSMVSAKKEKFIKSGSFNAQRLRVMIVAVQVGAVKIYVAAVEALRKKERQDETQLPPKLLVFWVLFMFENHHNYHRLHSE